MEVIIYILQNNPVSYIWCIGNNTAYKVQKWWSQRLKCVVDRLNKTSVVMGMKSAYKSSIERLGTQVSLKMIG